MEYARNQSPQQWDSAPLAAGEWNMLGTIHHSSGPLPHSQQNLCRECSLSVPDRDNDMTVNQKVEENVCVHFWHISPSVLDGWLARSLGDILLVRGTGQHDFTPPWHGISQRKWGALQ